MMRRGKGDIVNLVDTNRDGSSGSLQPKRSESQQSSCPGHFANNKKQTFFRRRRLSVAIGLAMAIIAAAAIRRVHHSNDVQGWSTAEISRGPVIRVVTATGTVDPVITVQVGSYVSGRISGIYADYNSPVRAGQLIAKVDPRPFQVKVDEANAALANAVAQLHKDIADRKYKRVAYERNANLLKKKAVSDDALDSARSAYDQATAEVELDQANIEQQQASLKDAKLNLEYTDIISPVGGTVIAREVDVGQTVAASFQTPTLFLIAKDLTKMQVDSNVSEADIGEVAPGQKAFFTVDAYEHGFSGVVAQVRRNPTTTQNVVTYDVVVTADNPRLLLAPGMTANVKIITRERKNVLRVPLQTVKYESAGASPESEVSTPDPQAFLWIPDGAQKKRLRVVTGVRDGTFVEIVGNVHPGDPVLVEPVAVPETDHANPRLPPGMP
jgi:HlyD family secretion protein